jgi:NADH-quinone oxidoreductase subunit G
MTVTTSAPTGGAPAEKRDDVVSLTIDGIETTVAKGTLIIRAAEQLGIAVPRFCDHPLLDPVAACRMCLIEVEGMPKPQPACAVTCGDGMVVRTQHTSPVSEDAQKGVMEFLLINHPLDCPICDKGGECPLQNQAMSNGRAETRFDGRKRTFPKPVGISAQVLLDRERCVSCARCTRFSEQVAGDPFIELLERGAQQQVGIAEGKPFNSYFSGNTIQICPVGALTSAMYRFRSRPFDLVSTPTACEHCASGCALRTDSRRGTVLRRMAAVDPQVNEEWNCDKGRFGFRYLTAADRLTTPLVREDGALRPASWPEALGVAAAGLASARGQAAVLAGGRLTLEDAYAYGKFARVVLGTNHVDFRARPSSDEEEQFLASRVAGRGLGPTYADLEAAPAVLLVALEPEDESPMVLLRLRKAARRGLRVFAVAPVATRGLAKVGGTLVATAPGDEPAALASMASGDGEAAAALRQPGTVVLVGERAAAVPGLLSAVAALADATGAQLGWVPRRAGERGSVDAGLLPSLLPGGRPVADARARADAGAVWGVDSLPAEPGLAGPAILRAAASGQLAALVTAGFELTDLPDAAEAAAALDAVGFLVALDTRNHAVTERADVVLPVAAVAEKAGTFVDWEGRPRPTHQVVRATSLMPDARVLTLLADELGVRLGLASLDEVRAELDDLGGWNGDRPEAPRVAPTAAAAPGAEGGLRLAGWRPLLDDGVLQQDEPYLARTARPLVAQVAAVTAERLGLADGGTVTVSGPSGSVTRPLEVADVVADVVVVHGRLGRELGCLPGSVVRITPGGAA